jgi:PIN domain
MGDIPQARPRLDFNVLYLDTNVLLRAGWPSASVELNNALLLASWWGVPVFIPEPVSMEAEAHWVRAVQKKVTALENAVNQLERVAKPIATQAKVEHLSTERLIEEYRTAVQSAMAKYQVNACPFTELSSKEMFSLASRCALPSEFEQGGKGFQDAVILSSVLQHLKSSAELTGILVTADSVFNNAQFADFDAGIPDERLRFLDLGHALGALWEPHWDETVTKPYAVERVNAKSAAELAIPILKEFISSRLTESMLKAGAFGKVLKLSKISEVNVMYVQTPLPDPAQPDRQVRIAIAVSAECTAIVEKDYRYLYSSFFRSKRCRLRGSLGTRSRDVALRLIHKLETAIAEGQESSRWKQSAKK